MNAQPKPKPTPTQHRAVNDDKHPQIKLVPDEARESHPVRTDGPCGAARWLNGIRVACELDVNHGGDHSHDGRSWRPRSGDPADIASAGA